MADTYGTRDATRFSPNGLGGEQYYTLIDSTSGNITIKKITATGTANATLGGSGESFDTTVGTIPQGGTFQSGSATTNEVQYFSSQQGLIDTKNQAVITAQKAGATNAQQLISPNTAQSDPAAPAGPGGAPPPAPALPDPVSTPQLAGEQFEIAGAAGLRYPKDIASTDQDRIQFTACEILPRTQPKIGPTGRLQTKFGDPSYKEVDGSVFLAIQSPISDQNSVDWGPDSLNAINAAMYNVSYGAIKGGENAVAEAIKTFLGGLYGTAQTEQGRFQRYLAGQAASINNILARTDNVVLNPNLELLFQGPQLRPFTFQFKMSARNQPEADEIKKIIKYFKYHMAVRQETSGLFLRAPHVFTIKYLKGRDESNLHPGINLISPTTNTKACALTNCSVDYTPLGSYMTYEDGTMVAYTLSLQFQEITPIYDTDYTKSQSIGY